MKTIVRLILILFALLSGATLVLAMGLPNQGYTWQIYANAYETLRTFLPFIIK